MPSFILSIIDRRQLAPDEAAYFLSVCCSLCGQMHVALLSCSYAPNPQEDRCYFCRVQGRLVYGSHADAVTLIQDNPAFRFLAQAGTHFVRLRESIQWGNRTLEPIGEKTHDC